MVSITEVIKTYKALNLNVIKIDSDNEFEWLENWLLPIKLNVAAAHKYLSNVERSIRSIKEGTRSLLH